MNRRRVGEDRGSKEMDECPLTVGYVWIPWGIHIDIVINRGSKGMDGRPLTGTSIHSLTSPASNSSQSCLYVSPQSLYISSPLQPPYDN
jgi:hypothetical protein